MKYNYKKLKGITLLSHYAFADYAYMYFSKHTYV